MLTRAVRRATGAAFVWLLAQPPVLPDGAIGAALPIGQWTVQGRHATSEACEQQLARNRNAILAAIGASADTGSQRARVLVEASHCIDSASGTSAPPASAVPHP